MKGELVAAGPYLWPRGEGAAPALRRRMGDAIREAVETLLVLRGLRK